MSIIHSKITKIFVLFFTLILYCKCGDKEYPIPNVSFNIYVDPVTVSQIGIGSAIYCSSEGGIKGIIIYRDDASTFSAYERLCTNYPNDTCSVTIDNATISAKCPCCGSEFSLMMNGDVLKSPAHWALKKYYTTYTGGRLYISN